MRCAWVLLWTACTATGSKDMVDTDTHTDTDTDVGETDVVDSEVSDPYPLSFGDWKFKRNPCTADVITFDEQGQGWLGCGVEEGGETGLFTTSDGGISWARPVTSPGSVLDSVRLVQTFEDDVVGDLYALALGDGGHVRRLASLEAPYVVTEELPEGVEAWTQHSWDIVHVGFSGVGLALTEQGDLALRRDRDRPWEDSSGWARPGDRIHGVELDRAVVLAIGADALDQPTVFYNPDIMTPDGVPPFGPLLLQRLSLSDDAGPLVAVAERGGVYLVAGHRLSDGMPRIWRAELSVRTIDDWEEFDLSSAVAGREAVVRAVCMSDDVYIVAGAWADSDEAMAIRSLDRGQSWTDMSPEGMPSMRYCQAGGDGGAQLLVLAGEGGVFGMHDPDDLWPVPGL